MKLHRYITASLFAIIAGSLLNAQAQDFAEFPITFEGAVNNYTFTDFGHSGTTSIVTDPADASNKVARQTRAADAETWAGVTFLDAKRIPFTETRKTRSSPDFPVKTNWHNLHLVHSDSILLLRG